MRNVLHLTAVLSAAFAAVVPGVALSQSQTQTTPNSGSFQGVPSNGASIAPTPTTDGGIGAGQVAPTNGQTQPVQLVPNPGTTPANPSSNGALNNQNGSSPANTSNNGVIDNRNGSNSSNNGVLENGSNSTPNNNINNGSPASGTVVNQDVPANAVPSAVQAMPANTSTGVNPSVPATGTVVSPSQTVQPGGQGVPANNAPVTAQPGAVISPNLRPDANSGSSGNAVNRSSAATNFSASQPTSTVIAGQIETGTLNDDLVRATCSQNWQQAVRIVNRAIAAAPASQSAYRTQLQQYRERLQDLQSADVQVPDWSNQCQ